MIADLAINLSIGVSIFAVALALASQITIWITLTAPQRREISFSGTPVDKRDCQELMTQCHAVHDQLFNRISGVERGVEARVTAKLQKSEDEGKETRRAMHQELTSIGNDVAALKKEAELSNQRACLMDAKIDRLIER
jgi:hypothetical protein